jgi:glycosyltransferase involved in cell wall biosynthesis
VNAALKLNRRLIVVGTGPEKVQPQAGRVEYLGHVSDDRLIELIRGCRALLFPGFEDFGMTPVEVMSCGRPVIAFGKGGALDTVVDGVTGVFAAEQTVDSFSDAIRRFEGLSFDPRRIAKHAKAFSFARFESSLHEAIAEVMQSSNSGFEPSTERERRISVVSGDVMRG